MAKVVFVSIVQTEPLRDPRVFIKECASLVRAGYQVVLIAVHPRDEVVQGVQVRGLPRPASRVERMTRTAYRAFRRCLAENADVYHFHDPGLLPWMARIARSGKPVVYDMHENVLKDILTKDWITPLLRPLVSWVTGLGMRLWVPRMRVVFAELSYAGDYPWIKDSVIVLNMPLADELLAVREPQSPEPAVAYYGGVTAERGSLVTLEALRLLKQQGRSVGFQCLGPVSERHRRDLESFVARHALTGVRCHGFVPHDEGYAMLARCRIGLAVLSDIPNYRESFPTKIFEYMALGLPVIASNFPLYSRVVEEEQVGLCVDPADPTALAAAIGRLLDDPQRAAAMGARGREAVRRRYRWGTEEAKLLRLYEELLGAPAPRPA